MIYGPTKSSKTTQCYFFAKWLWESFHLKTRYIVGDPGGYAPFIDSGMIQEGIVDTFDYTNRPLALADFRRLATGYWPRYTMAENGVSQEYFKSDEHCKTTQEQFAEIGAYIIEGMASVGETLKTHCSDQPSGAIGFKEAWSYEEDGEVMRGLTMGHYDIVQKEIRKMHVQGFCTLPVKYIIWTSLLGKSSEKKANADMSRDTQLGPQLVGTASTTFIPSWFYECFRLTYEDVPTPYPNGETKEKKLVAWFVNHVDSDSGMMALAGCRTLPEVFPELLRYFPTGYVPLGFRSGIENFYKVLAVINKKGG